jgi:glycosyltransferase involved in cell wall biosynthesis
VLLPVYNGERYVGETIESILPQSYLDFEFLIIDDGSVDSTPSILGRYAVRDARIRVLRQNNRGVGCALNRGIHGSRGLLIAQIGADDLALPHRLARQVQFLDDHPDCVLVGGYLKVIDGRGRVIGLRTYPTSDRDLRNAMLSYSPFGAPSLMFRRTEGLVAGGFTVRFPTAEDYESVFRLAKQGKVANLPEALTSYRLHSGATKSQHTIRQLRDTLRARQTAYTEYGHRESFSARIVNIAQILMTRLPAPLIYWLYAKVLQLSYLAEFRDGAPRPRAD